jgi:hypothetical protein
MPSGIDSVTWNRLGEEADRRLKNRGVVKYSAQEYQATFREVLSEHQQGKGMRAIRYQKLGAPDVRVYLDASGNIADMETEFRGKNLHDLVVLVAGFPRGIGGEVDLQGAVQTLNSNARFRDLTRAASGDWLTQQVHKRMKDVTVSADDIAGGNPRGGLFGRVLTQVQADYPAVASIYAGGAVIAEGLQEMLWVLFEDKAATRQAEQHHKYSALRKYVV